MSDAKRGFPLPPTDILTVAVATGAVFFALAFGGKLVEAHRLQRHNAALQAEVASLQERQRELQEKLAYVRSAAYAERVAREQFKWVAPQDKLVITTYRYRPDAEGNDRTSGLEMGAQHESSGWTVPGWLARLLSRFD